MAETDMPPPTPCKSERSTDENLCGFRFGSMTWDFERKGVGTRPAMIQSADGSSK